MSPPIIFAAAALIAGSARPALAAESASQLREIVWKAATAFNLEDERREQFLFKARNERREFDSNGKVTSEKSTVWERIEIDGFAFGRTLIRDGKPLTAEERKSEDDAMQKRLVALKVPVQTAGIGRTEQRELQQQTANMPRRKTAQNEWFQEFPEALDYTFVGEEVLNGRPTLHLAATPRAGYQAKNMRARVFEKMKCQLWIDKTAMELVRADAEVFDTFNVGFGLLGRIEKGTRFQIQRRPVVDGVWLIHAQSVRFGARVLLFKNMHQESVNAWTDFRRRATPPVAATAAVKP
jgi:hypothetical protein